MNLFLVDLTEWTELKRGRFVLFLFFDKETWKCTSKASFGIGLLCSLMSNKHELKTTPENGLECAREGVTDSAVEVHAAQRGVSGSLSRKCDHGVTVSKHPADACVVMSGARLSASSV